MFCIALPGVAAEIQTNTYGTASESVYTIPVFELKGADSSITVAIAGSPISYYVNGASGLAALVAPVHLPSGALITKMEIYGCDSNPNARFYSSFRGISRIGVLDFTDSGPATADADVPNCFFPSISFNRTIDNEEYYYWVEIEVTALDSSIRIAAVRLYYKLQVSPAPASATFNDVPTSHPFFQYIQALAASGITAGCSVSPPQYCPDAPLTRGQMAVFLARGLGLHWVP